MTRPASFDTVVAIGNNLGLLGTPETAGSFLDAARAIGSNDMRIVGTMLDPYLTDWASEAELADVCATHGWSVVATKHAGILYAAELRPA